jgi:hypothetical protein
MNGRRLRGLFGAIALALARETLEVWQKQMFGCETLQNSPRQVPLRPV